MKSKPVVMDGLPLHKAIRDGNIEAARTWIEAGVNINEKDAASGDTPLYVAVSTRNIEILKLLVEKGADIGEKHPIFDETPLDLALNNSDKKMVEILIKAGAGINVRSESAWIAVQHSPNQSEPFMETNLIDAEDEVISTSPNSLVHHKLALHSAVKKNDVVMIEYLLSRGADVNVRENSKYTPLHNAVIHNKGKSHLDAIKVLLEHRADLDAVDDHGMTPIHYLKRDSQVNDEILELIFNHMTDNGPKNKNNGKTSPKSAREKKGPSCLKKEERNCEKQNEKKTVVEKEACYDSDTTITDRQNRTMESSTDSAKFCETTVIDLWSKKNDTVEKWKKPSGNYETKMEIQKWQKLEENIEDIRENIEKNIVSQLGAIHVNNKSMSTTLKHLLLLVTVFFCFIIQFCFLEY